MRKADNLPPFCAVVTKSGNLNFLEPSGPLRACKGTDLPLQAHRNRLTFIRKKVADMETVYAHFYSSK